MSSKEMRTYSDAVQHLPSQQHSIGVLDAVRNFDGPCPFGGGGKICDGPQLVFKHARRNTKSPK